MGVNTHGPFERVNVCEHPRRGDFTPTGLLPFAFQTSHDLCRAGAPGIPFAILRSNKTASAFSHQNQHGPCSKDECASMSLSAAW
jgi:hypothetical protein